MKLDLRSFVETWAWQYFQQRADPFESRLLERGHVAFTFDWKRVRFATPHVLTDTTKRSCVSRVRGPVRVVFSNIKRRYEMMKVVEGDVDDILRLMLEQEARKSDGSSARVGGCVTTQKRRTGPDVWHSVRAQRSDGMVCCGMPHSVLRNERMAGDGSSRGHGRRVGGKSRTRYPQCTCGIGACGRRDVGNNVRAETAAERGDEAVYENIMEIKATGEKHNVHVSVAAPPRERMLQEKCVALSRVRAHIYRSKEELHEQQQPKRHAVDNYKLNSHRPSSVNSRHPGSHRRLRKRSGDLSQRPRVTPPTPPPLRPSDAKPWRSHGYIMNTELVVGDKNRTTACDIDRRQEQLLLNTHVSLEDETTSKCSSYSMMEYGYI